MSILRIENAGVLMTITLGYYRDKEPWTVESLCRVIQAKGNVSGPAINMMQEQKFRDSLDTDPNQQFDLSIVPVESVIDPYYEIDPTNALRASIGLGFQACPLWSGAIMALGCIQSKRLVVGTEPVAGHMFGVYCGGLYSDFATWSGAGDKMVVVKPRQTRRSPARTFAVQTTTERSLWQTLRRKVLI